MTFTNYLEFRIAVQRLIEGDDNLSDLSVDTLDQLIGLGEERVYGDFRSRFMEDDLAVTVVNGVAQLPDDCLELKILYFDSTRPIEIVTETSLRDTLRLNGSSGPTKRAAQAGNSLIFWPAATNGTILIGRYYRRLPDIKTGLNAMFDRYSPMFLYAALSAAAPFLGQDARLVMWDALFKSYKTQYERQEQGVVYGGSNLRVRPSVSWVR